MLIGLLKLHSAFYYCVDERLTSRLVLGLSALALLLGTASFVIGLIPLWLLLACAVCLSFGARHPARCASRCRRVSLWRVCVWCVFCVRRNLPRAAHRAYAGVRGAAGDSAAGEGGDRRVAVMWGGVALVRACCLSVILVRLLFGKPTLSQS